MNYESIKPYYALLKDHPMDFVYYGKPKDEFYLEFDTENENGDFLVMSYECNELCEELGYLLKDVPTIDLEEDSITSEKKEYLCTMATEEEVQSVVMSIIDSLSYNDYFISCLNDGFLVRIIGYLLTFSK